MKSLLNLALLSGVHLFLVAASVGNENFGFTRKALLASNEDDIVSEEKLYTRSSGIYSRKPKVSAKDLSISFQLGNVPFISPFNSEHGNYTLNFINQVPWLDQDSLPLPVTVIELSSYNYSCQDIHESIKTFSKIDDVWMPEFLQGIYFTGSASNDLIQYCFNDKNELDVSLILSDDRAFVKNIYPVESFNNQIPPGPYLATVSRDQNLILSPVYRLYRDKYQAFTSPAIAANDGTFMSLTGEVGGMNYFGIAVPSRVYTHGRSTPDKPLLGKRVAVKDIFDVAGLKTGCGSRAYFELYGKAKNNSAPVQRLIEAGATIIGKTKTSQFAYGDNPTADSVDQMIPFNPRADGYMSPGGSSTGSAVSVAAYDFIDYSIGSDTGGSVRGPAALSGVYGLRPSHEATSLEGVLPLCSELDTAGYFSRDAELHNTFGKAWYGDKFKSFPKFPKKIYVSSDSSGQPDELRSIEEGFYNNLSLFLNATIDTNDLKQLWEDTMHDKVGDVSMATYLGDTYITLIGFDQYNKVAVPFFKDYSVKWNGREPFLNPKPVKFWEFGSTLTKQDYDTGMEQKEVFKDFYQNSVLKSDPESCSESLHVFLQYDGTPNYRDEYMEAPSTLRRGAFTMGYASSFAGTPEIVIPIGQISYDSRVSNSKEYNPVAMSIVAQNGCDYMLLDLAAALKDAGIISPVRTGRVSF